MSVFGALCLKYFFLIFTRLMPAGMSKNYFLNISKCPLNILLIIAAISLFQVRIYKTGPDL